MKGDLYEMDLVLRNNITTEESPWGVYHPEEKYHHIKKENIGLIEVMGLAVLPARLQKEMDILCHAIVDKQNLRTIAEVSKHADWVEEWRNEYENSNNFRYTCKFRSIKSNNKRYRKKKRR
jgi:UDPglucose--hexose-1-phosphate uridylyltransferase